MNIKEAYELAAVEYRKKYEKLPTRTDEVDKAFSYLEKNNPSVFEIGCAYGREAKYILTKTRNYIGIDISSKFIVMAQNEISEGEFVCADVLDYDFSQNFDCIFAFASLLHTSKEEMETLLQRMSQALNPGGVIFLSLKRREGYATSIETDDLVSRRFYYYTRETIHNIAPAELKEVFYEEQVLKEPWFTMILQKTFN